MFQELFFQSCRPVRVLPIRFRFPQVFTLKGSFSDSGSFLTRSFHSRRRSYYLFLYYLFYYLYGDGFSPKNREEGDGFSPKCAGVW